MKPFYHISPVYSVGKRNENGEFIMFDVTEGPRRFWAPMVVAARMKRKSKLAELKRDEINYLLYDDLGVFRNAILDLQKLKDVAE